MNKIVNSKLLLHMILFTLILGAHSAATAQISKPLSLNQTLQRWGYQTIPITVKNDFLYINASINKHRATAILDTGSAAINVMKGTAKKLKLPTFNTTKNAGIDMYGRKSFQQSVILHNVTIGNIHLRNVTAHVFQHVTPSNIPTLVVGRVFLQRNHAIIDLPHQKLYLGHKKLSQFAMLNIQKTLLHQKSRAIPLLRLASGSIVIPLQINRLRPVLFLFDTGTGITLLSQAYAKTQHLDQRSKTKEILITTLIMNPLNLSVQPKMSLNGVSVQPANLIMLRRYLYVQGIFGLADMMKAHAIIFLTEGIVYLCSN